MSQTTGAMVFLVLIVMLSILAGWGYRVFERRKKMSVSRQFKDFQAEHPHVVADMRTVPRIGIPETMDVVLTFRDARQRERRAVVIDISMNGMASEPRFSLRRVRLPLILEDARVQTPINHFHIRRLKMVRMGRATNQKVLGFAFEDVEAEQFEELKSFMTYLNRFLAHGH